MSAMKMDIIIYGKEGCNACHEAKDNINKAIRENKLEDKINLIFHDVEKDPSAKAKFIALSPDNKYPMIVMKDFGTGQSSKIRGMAPSVDYITDYFRHKGYI